MFVSLRNDTLNPALETENRQNRSTLDTTGYLWSGLTLVELFLR